MIYVPATGLLYWGGQGIGAYRAETPDAVSEGTAIACRSPPDGPLTVVASRSHRSGETDTFIGRFDVGDLVSAGSSLKFCRVAEGAADLYPRLGATMQWDTAAGDAILRAAGGSVVTMEGAPLGYGPDSAATGAGRFANPWFVATGGLDPFAG